jgi:hypothetical protein
MKEGRRCGACQWNAENVMYHLLDHGGTLRDACEKPKMLSEEGEKIATLSRKCSDQGSIQGPVDSQIVCLLEDLLYCRHPETIGDRTSKDVIGVGKAGYRRTSISGTKKGTDNLPA